MKVVYFSDDIEFQRPLVTLNWSNNDVDTSLTIDELHVCDLEEIENFRDCMISGDNSCSIRGGGNSYWSISCGDKILRLEFIISGMGNGSTFITKVPCDLLLDQFNHLVDLREHMTRSEKYIGVEWSIY
jgi:hypothetical protein